jgi:RNA polymerase sigma-70 factor (ECF subfamily)
MAEHLTDDIDERLRRGDTQALAELVEANRERLLRSLRLRLDARLERRVAPEDVLQEAWLAARQRIAHYAADGFTRPYTWLRAVVLQTLVDVHRHHLGAQMRDARCEVPVAGGRLQPEATSAVMGRELSGRVTTPSGAAMQEESARLVTGALERLGPADREVIALRHFEDLGNDEVAEVLGIQAKAASIRYIRAVRRLKDELERSGLTLSDLGG